MNSIDRPEQSILSVVEFSLLILVFLAAIETFSRIGTTTATLIWLTIYAAVFLFIATNLDKTIAVLSKNWVVLLTPFIALTSAFWSPTPEWTLIASIQLLFSALIAVWIGMSFQALTIYKALAIATGIGLAASLLNYHFQFIPAFKKDDFVGAEQYFIGIYTQKNVLGKVFDLFALSMLIVAIGTKRVWLGLLIVAILIIPLLETKSASSLVAYFIIITFPIMWWIKKNVENIALLIAFFISIGLFLVFLASTGSVDILDNALSIIGKDSSFTGRTVLWDAGGKVITEHPFLGVGYQAYWREGQFLDIKSLHNTLPEGVNGFHNLYVEILVATGMLGFLAYLGFHITAIINTVRWTMLNASAESLGTIYLILIITLLAQFDVVAYRQHEAFFLLLVMITVMSSDSLRSQKTNLR